MSCAICEQRKEKRFCPAVHGRICAVCCGTEREVSLDCPSTCAYLQQARANEKPRELSGEELTAAFPEVEIRQQLVYEREPLLVGLHHAVAQGARADRSVADRDVLAALSAVARRYQTLVNSGLHFEEAMPSLPQQAITTELQKIVEQYRELEAKHMGYSSLRDSDVLQALVFVLRMGLRRTSGRPRSRAFVEWLQAQFPEREGVVAPAAAPSRLIVP